MSRKNVGIVIVSHSERLASGVCEVAAQMAPDVTMVPAGGTDEGGVGTSFDKILAAANDADGGEGVVILYDLGSAKMSAELVAEMSPGARVVDAPLVEGAIAAAVAAQGGANADAVAAGAAAAAAGTGVAAEGGDGAHGSAGHAAAIGRVFTLRNPFGLHARPAARLARIASDFAVTIGVGRDAGGAGDAGKLVDVRSILALVALGLRGGDAVRVEVSGERAAEALAAIGAAIDDGFGENAADTAFSSGVAAGAGAGVASAPGSGIAAAPGIAIGPIRRIRMAAPVVPESFGDPGTERARLDEALAHVDRELARERSDLGEAHRTLLADPQLATAARTAIATGLSAAPAWWRAVQSAREQLAASTDDLVAHRAMDVTDVGTRVLSRLLPESTAVDWSDLKSAIVLAEDVTPSMVGQLADAGAAGIVLAQGGVTAHSVVVARGRGLPMLVRAGEHASVADGTVAILDADRGAFLVAPEPRIIEEARARQASLAAARSAALEAAHTPVTGPDGRTITIAANVASPAEAHLARKQGADAIGLLRTELFYVDKPHLPTEDEQIQHLARILEPFAEREVTIRTLDVGGDKDIPALGLDPIVHGFLGLRGLRYGLVHPETLRVQLRAIMRAAAGWKGTLSVMAPMVTTADEVVAFRSMLAEVARSLEGQPHRRPDHIGIMVEVPASALAFDTLAAHVDFVSVGTNDLVQYIMASERTNASVAHLYQPDHPAVWRALELLVRTSATTKIAVCGEMAAHPAAARRLVDLGIRELSMAPSSIPTIKGVLRSSR